MPSNPQVGIVMGSPSDLDTIRPALDVFEEFGIEYGLNVISAHRSPDRAHAYARDAEARGYQVIIAAAGGAAHLAGVIASLTPLPVIGVPVPSGALSGLDALYSTVQMPSGVPVASMAIGKSGAKNAAILAVQILSVAEPSLREMLREYKARLAEKVEENDEKIRQFLARQKEAGKQG